MSGLLDQFPRTRKGRPCPICGREDWCLVEYDGAGEVTRALCKRVASDRQWRQAGSLHVLRDTPLRARPRGPRQITLEPRRTYGELVAEMEHGLEPDRRHRFAASLGVSVDSLRRLRVGFAHWDAMHQLGLRPSRGAFTFPMVDHRARAIGVRVRLEGGKKLCVKGSALGMFVPQDLDATGVVFIAEGESDTAALLTLGVEALGIPGAGLCGELVAKLARERSMKDVVVVADGDDKGQHTAEQLARALAVLVPSVRLVTPPTKDVRDWLRAGATAIDLVALVAAARPLSRGLEQKVGAV